MVKGKRSNGPWRPAKSENKMGKRIKLVIGPGLVDMERYRDGQMKVNEMGNIRKLYHLAFTITMKSCPGELAGRFRGRIGQVLMMDNQVMKNELGSNAEGKYQQHQSAQSSPYGRLLQQIP